MVKLEDLKQEELDHNLLLSLPKLKEKATEDDTKKFQDEMKEYTKKQEERRKDKEKYLTETKKRMERDRRELQISVTGWSYWYYWGMLFGFLFLAGGSLGYLGGDQPSTRRVLACIVLSGMMLVIIVVFTFMSAAASTVRGVGN